MNYTFISDRQRGTDVTLYDCFLQIWRQGFY